MSLMAGRNQRRSVVTKECSFDDVQREIKFVHEQTSSAWIVIGFRSASSGDALEQLASGMGPMCRNNLFPKPLFEPSSLCYGIYHLVEPGKGVDAVIAFCWKGTELPVSLRTKHTEHKNKIQDFLGGTLHLDVKNERDLHDETLLKQLPVTKRRTLSKVMIGVKKCEFSKEVSDALDTIRSSANPFNWMVCEYDDKSDEGDNKVVLVDIGMSGLHGLKGIGGIANLLKLGKTMYLYIRVEVSMQFQPDDTVSKYVLVTWQGSLLDNGYDSDGKEESEVSLRNSAVLGQAHAHASEIYRFFPHHVHFFASSMSELSEEIVKERLRCATDSDGMLLRVVCVQSSGDYQPAVCVEVPRDCTVKRLRQILACNIGIPEDSQHIVWIHSEDNFCDGKWSPRSVAMSLVDDNHSLRNNIGLEHGDKIHIEDTHKGKNSPLVKLVNEINAGVGQVSLSAERRHEVQRGVEAQEADLKSRLSDAHKMILEKIAIRKKSCSSEVAVHAEITGANATSPGSSQNTSETLGGDVEALEKQVKELEAQNEYLEIPYDSVRILEGKANELGCGRAATVYRGLWMSRNGATEVAVKKFRYHNLTDKVVKDYRLEVALLRKLRHPNIVLFIGACTHPTLLILTEFCSRGSLYSVLHNKPVFEVIPWKWKVRMVLDAARGIKYLHSVSIIHRDIKSHNMLVDDEWRLKVADFGISKVLDESTQAYTQCGTTGWVAPEVLVDEEEGYSFRADNWSFSIVMWEMVAGDNVNPFIGMAPVKFYRLAKEGKRPDISDDVDSAYAALIRDCWQADPSERPSFSMIVERLEKIALDLDMDISLPLSFKGGYHAATLDTD